jgi:outer membrane protein assembly factor BamE
MRLVILLFIPFLLAGCRLYNPIEKLRPHKIDIQQGNAITQEMVDKLKPGMTQSQVRFILGTPLVQDPFHPNRWDYFYRYVKGGVVTEERRITAVFEEGKLKGIEGNVVISSQPLIVNMEKKPEPEKKPEGDKP